MSRRPLEAIEKGNFKLAAHHLKYRKNNTKEKTKYHTQTGNRARTIAYALAYNSWK